MKRWIVLVVVLAGCSSCARTRDRSTFEPPPAFDSFDRVVQERFTRRLAALEQARATRAPATDVARAYGELGHWYAVYGFSELAEQCYEQAMALDVDEARWPYFLGHVLALGTRTDQTVEAFGIALARAPEAQVARLRLAEAVRVAGQPEQAETLLRDALERAPNTAFAWAELGRLAADRGDFAVAVDHFEHALALQPNASSVRYALGQVHRGLGNVEQARALLTQVEEENRRQIPIALPDPWLQELDRVRDGVVHHVGAGKRARRAGRMAKAIEHFRLGVAADDENLDARIEMAITLGDLGRYPAAIRELEEAQRLFPDNARTHFFLGTLLLKQRRFQEAEAQLRASLALDPHNATVFFNLAQVLRADERLAASIPYYTQARERNPKMSRAAFWQAIVRVRLGEPISSVVPLLESACRDAPDNADAAALLMRVRAISGDVVAAGAALDERVSPHVLWAESVAMVLAARGDGSGATRWQREALRAIEAAGGCAANLARDRLVRYEAGERAVEPWHATEVVCELPVAPPPTAANRR